MRRIAGMSQSRELLILTLLLAALAWVVPYGSIYPDSNEAAACRGAAGAYYPISAYAQTEPKCTKCRATYDCWTDNEGQPICIGGAPPSKACQLCTGARNWCQECNETPVDDGPGGFLP